jgi:hypothetical protein
MKNNKAWQEENSLGSTSPDGSMLWDCPDNLHLQQLAG